MQNKLKPSHDWTYFAGSLAVSAILLWYLLAKIEITDLVKLFRNIYLPGFLIYLVLYGGLVAFRALRFRILIGSEKIGFGNTVLVTMVRNLFVDLLPARVGALSYVYVLKRRFGFALEIGVATLLISFLFDLLVIVPLIGMAIFVVGAEGNVFYNPFFVTYSGVMLVMFSLVIQYIHPLLSKAYRVSAWIFERLSLEKTGVIRYILEKFRLTITQVQTIKDRGILGQIFGISVLVRLSKYACLYYLLYALLHSEGVRLDNLDFWKVFLCIAGAELSAMLPVHGFAGLGTWATVWSLVFRIMGFDERLAVLSGLGVHLVTQVVEYTIGIIAILFLITPQKGNLYKTRS